MIPDDNLPGFRNYSASQVNEIVETLLSLRDRSGRLFIETIGKERVIEIMNTSILNQIGKELKNTGKSHVDLVDFVKIVLKIVDHEEDERVFFIVSIVEFFKEMSEGMDFAQFVKPTDISSFIVENFVEKNLVTYSVPTKHLPEAKHFKIDPNKVRDIDIEAPIVYGATNLGLRRQDPSKIYTDSYHHLNPIKEAFFSRELGRLFSLDSLSESIIVYKESDVEKELKPKTSKKSDFEIILHFAFSERSRRIGACLKNFSLSFWDWSDDFSFEKNINTSLEVHDYQIKIWHLEALDIWVTTDQTATLFIWDILQENVKKRLVTKFDSKFIENRAITDVAEIDYLRLVAVSSSDKQINIWNFLTGRVIISVNMLKGGVHQIKYSRTYQLLLTAGYENTIPAFSITPHYNDLNLLGRLVGHLSIVTSVAVIEGTPMVLSSDDSGVVKAWDIRTQRCLQTIELGQKTLINKLVVLETAVAVLGSRVTFIEFDDSYPNEKANKESVYPIKAEFNRLADEIILCVRSGVRIIDVKNGTTKRIFRSFFAAEEEEELTVMKFLQKSKKYILGDQKGNLNVFNYGTGELMNKLEAHGFEVALLRVDYLNKLIVTYGRDSTLKIQQMKSGIQLKEQGVNDFADDEKAVALASEMALKEVSPFFVKRKENKEASVQVPKRRKTLVEMASGKKEKENEFVEKKEYEVFRVLKNLNHGKEVATMDVSVYHNLIAFSSENKIAIVDYEYMKPLGEIVLRENEEVTALGFANGFGLLFAATTKGLIYCFHVDSKENTLENMELLGLIELGSPKIEVANHFLVDFNFIEKGVSEKMKQIERKESFKSSNSSRKSEGEAKRETPGNFIGRTLDEIEEESFESMNVHKLKKSFASEASNVPDGESVASGSFILSRANLTKDIEAVSCEIYIAETKGNVHRIDLMDFLKQPGLGLRIHPHTCTRSNYNAFRNVSERFESPMKTFKFSFDNNNEEYERMCKMGQVVSRLVKFKAHKDSLTSISFIYFPSKFIVTTSLDSYMKIFSVNGVCQCSINVNHPLPMKWFLADETKERAKEKIIFGLEVIDSLFKRNYEMLYSDQILLRLQKFIMSLLDSPSNITNYFIMKQNGELVEHSNNPSCSRSRSSSRKTIRTPANQPGSISNFSRKVPAIKIPKSILPSGKETPKPHEVPTMADEYSPRDLQFEKVKGMYEAELIGASLKQMDVAKKMINAQKQWREEAQLLEKQEQQQMSQVASINHHRNDQAPFFSEMRSKKLYRPKNKYAYELMRKFEQLANPGGFLAKEGEFPSKAQIDELLIRNAKMKQERERKSQKSFIYNTMLFKQNPKKANLKTETKLGAIDATRTPQSRKLSSVSISTEQTRSVKMGHKTRESLSPNHYLGTSPENKGIPEPVAEFQEASQHPGIRKAPMNFFDYANGKFGVNLSPQPNSKAKHSQMASLQFPRSTRDHLDSTDTKRIKRAHNKTINTLVLPSINDSAFNELEETKRAKSKDDCSETTLKVPVDRKIEKQVFRKIVEGMNQSVKKSKNLVFSKGVGAFLEMKGKSADQRGNLRSVDMSPKSLAHMGASRKEKEDQGDIFKRNPDQNYEMSDLLESKVFKSHFSIEERKKILEVCSKKSSQSRDHNRKFTSITSNNLDNFQLDLARKLKTLKSDNNIITEF